MYSPEFARTFHADRERQVREHVRVRRLVHDAADAAARHDAERSSRTPRSSWAAGGREPARGGAAR
jgi:hypothetical protein